MRHAQMRRCAQVVQRQKDEVKPRAPRRLLQHAVERRAVQGGERCDALHPLTPALSRQARLGVLATQRDRIRERMRIGGEGAGRACGEEVLSSMARSPLPSRERGRGEGEAPNSTSTIFARAAATIASTSSTLARLFVPIPITAMA